MTSLPVGFDLKVTGDATEEVPKSVGLKMPIGACTAATVVFEECECTVVVAELSGVEPTPAESKQILFWWLDGCCWGVC